MDNRTYTRHTRHTRPTRVFKPKAPFDPSKFSSDEIKILRNLIKYRKRGKFSINFNVMVELDYDFAMQIGDFIAQNYRGDDPAIHKFAEELLNGGKKEQFDE